MFVAPAALALIGAGVSAAGTIYGGLAANAQAQYQARIAERNADLEREAAQTELQNTRDAAQAQYRKIAAVKGQQVAGAAGNGVVTNFGTAADAVADTDFLGREDVNRIYQQGNQRMRGHDIGASNFMAEAAADRAKGSSAIVSSLFSAGSTVLGGASQYGKLKNSLVSDVRDTMGRNAAIF